MPKEKEEILDIDRAIEYLREIKRKELEENLTRLRKAWNDPSLRPTPISDGLTRYQCEEQYKFLTF